MLKSLRKGFAFVKSWFEVGHIDRNNFSASFEDHSVCAVAMDITELNHGNSEDFSKVERPQKQKVAKGGSNKIKKDSKSNREAMMAQFCDNIPVRAVSRSR